MNDIAAFVAHVSRLIREELEPEGVDPRALKALKDWVRALEFGRASAPGLYRDFSARYHEIAERVGLPGQVPAPD